MLNEYIILPPRSLYQARDARINVFYSTYVYEQINWNSSLFIGQLFDHLSNLGIPLDQVKIQTDNIAELLRRGLDLSIPSAFEKAIADAGASYVRIPLGAENHQSDVGRANGLIEYELLEIERWKTKSELIGLTTT